MRFAIVGDQLLSSAVRSFVLSHHQGRSTSGHAATWAMRTRLVGLLRRGVGVTAPQRRAKAAPINQHLASPNSHPSAMRCFRLRPAFAILVNGHACPGEWTRRVVERASRQRQRRFHSAAASPADAQAAATEYRPGELQKQARKIRKAPYAQKCGGVALAPRYCGALRGEPSAVSASTSRVNPPVKSGLVGEITFTPTMRMKGNTPGYRCTI